MNWPVVFAVLGWCWLSASVADWMCGSFLTEHGEDDMTGAGTFFLFWPVIVPVWGACRSLCFFLDAFAQPREEEMT